MASGGHQMIEKRRSVEAHIKQLLNPILKDICKAYGQQVSGTKAILQQRVIDVADSFVQKGDPVGLDKLYYRVRNQGAAPPPGASTSTTSVSYAMAPGGAKPPAARMAHLRDAEAGAEMPQNRHTVRVNITLSDEQARRLKEDSSTRLLIYCGQTSDIAAWSRLDIAFPNQLEVKLNNDDVKGNFKGLKNKPGSTKPADITDWVRKVAGYQNQLSICYALTSKRYAFTVHLVKSRTAEELTQRIRTARVISKQKVIDEMKQANADPDIAAMSSKMSLKDPVSTMRIRIPIRSTVCHHNQCFDGGYFMLLQEQAPTWSCPICSKMVSFESLCVDKYFEEILSTTASSIEQVTIEPDGIWRVEEDDEDKGKSNQARGEVRASYDDDFDDDSIINLDDTPDASAARVNIPAKWLEPPFGQPNLNTPPLSSREPSVAQSVTSAQRVAGQKRPSAVIDLTLSDEDEPPRPAKRVQTSNSAPSLSSRSYATSASIPEPPRPSIFPARPAEPAPRSTSTSSFQAPPPRPRTPSGFNVDMSMSPPAQPVTFGGPGPGSTAFGAPLRPSASPGRQDSEAYNGFADPPSSPPMGFRPAWNPGRGSASRQQQGVAGGLRLPYSGSGTTGAPSGSGSGSGGNSQVWRERY
ncbi:E3 SUMO-protein ligase pli1 [Oleoguttula sp. CCFEE 5521]